MVTSRPVLNGFPCSLPCLPACLVGHLQGCWCRHVRRSRGHEHEQGHSQRQRQRQHQQRQDHPRDRGRKGARPLGFLSPGKKYSKHDAEILEKPLQCLVSVLVLVLVEDDLCGTHQRCLLALMSRILFPRVVVVESMIYSVILLIFNL